MTIIYIEGNIGTGKSTLIENIGEGQVEPITTWQKGENIFEKYYTDMKRWSFTFQVYASMTKMLSERELLSDDSSSGVDGSIRPDHRGVPVVEL